MIKVNREAEKEKLLENRTNCFEAKKKIFSSKP
jgi:hypothetical protein